MPNGETVREYTMRLRGIRFNARMGASREERAVPQEIIVDVDLELPLASLPKRDIRRDVVDYDAVASSVAEEALAQPYRLLETFVARVVERLLAETPAVRVRVAATKARVPTKYSVAAAIIEVVGVR